MPKGGLDNYMVQLLGAGSTRGEVDGGGVSAGPGDIRILDLARTPESGVDADGRITVTVPRAELERRLGQRGLHGQVLKAEWPMTRLISDYLAGLARVADRLTSQQGFAVQDGLVTLLAGALRGMEAPGDERSSGLTLAPRTRILDFIDGNIGNPELGPELLMRRFRVSRAHLYRILATEGGVAKAVRDRRLDAAYRELSLGRKPASTITEISYRLGFSSSNQFLRAFRGRFGATPSEVRRASTEPGPATRSLLGLRGRFVGHAARDQGKPDPAVPE